MYTYCYFMVVAMELHYTTCLFKPMSNIQVLNDMLAGILAP